MELPWIFIVFISICGEVAASPDTKFGQDATLNCSLDNSDIYWFMELRGPVPVPILRTFHKISTVATYNQEIFRRKYLVQLGHRLVIKNFSKEDCGMYYCAKKQKVSEFLEFSEGLSGKITSWILIYTVAFDLYLRPCLCKDTISYIWKTKIALGL